MNSKTTEEMTKITLSNMEFYAFHGCLSHEKALGNLFLVSVTLWFNANEAQISDNLDDTINYKQVYDIVKMEIEKPSDLLENLAYRIINSLKISIIEVEKWKVEVSKLNPPLGGKCEKVSVCLEL
ncbi:MAG: dihydroneopterin aldolase [Prevotellaceae bacterium]|jgi:dihydroneopterin aldolase|nr:dihydroneopterin aldolase [Prevotellaceae bacterium]